MVSADGFRIVLFRYEFTDCTRKMSTATILVICRVHNLKLQKQKKKIIVSLIYVHKEKMFRNDTTI